MNYIVYERCRVAVTLGLSLTCFQKNLFSFSFYFLYLDENRHSTPSSRYIYVSPTVASEQRRKGPSSTRSMSLQPTGHGVVYALYVQNEGFRAISGFPITMGEQSGGDVLKISIYYSFHQHEDWFPPSRDE